MCLFNPSQKRNDAKLFSLLVHAATNQNNQPVFFFVPLCVFLTLWYEKKFRAKAQ
jgi:hypothetical protein